MTKHQEDKWINFWKNLKEGYDLFDITGQPPTTEHQNQTYSFSGRI